MSKKLDLWSDVMNEWQNAYEKNGGKKPNSDLDIEAISNYALYLMYTLNYCPKHAGKIMAKIYKGVK